MSVMKLMAIKIKFIGIKRPSEWGQIGVIHLNESWRAQKGQRLNVSPSDSTLRQIK